MKQYSNVFTVVFVLISITTVQAALPEACQTINEDIKALEKERDQLIQQLEDNPNSTELQKELQQIEQQRVELKKELDQCKEQRANTSETSLESVETTAEPVNQEPAIPDKDEISSSTGPCRSIKQRAQKLEQRLQGANGSAREKIHTQMKEVMQDLEQCMNQQEDTPPVEQETKENAEPGDTSFAIPEQCQSKQKKLRAIEEKIETATGGKRQQLINTANEIEKRMSNCMKSVDDVKVSHNEGIDVPTVNNLQSCEDVLKKHAILQSMVEEFKQKQQTEPGVYDEALQKATSRLNKIQERAEECETKKQARLNKTVSTKVPSCEEIGERMDQFKENVQKYPSMVKDIPTRIRNKIQQCGYTVPEVNATQVCQELRHRVKNQERTIQKLRAKIRKYKQRLGKPTDQMSNDQSSQRSKDEIAAIFKEQMKQEIKTQVRQEYNNADTQKSGTQTQKDQNNSAQDTQSTKQGNATPSQEPARQRTNRGTVGQVIQSIVSSII